MSAFPVGMPPSVAMSLPISDTTASSTGRRAGRRPSLVAVGLLALVVLAGCSSIGGLPGTATETDTGLVTDGETLTVDPAPAQTVEGRTDLAAGAQVAIRLRASGEDPFLKSESATVENGGAFSAAFNMSGIEPGTEFDVTVTHNGTTLIEADGRVAA